MDFGKAHKKDAWPKQRYQNGDKGTDTKWAKCVLSALFVESVHRKRIDRGCIIERWAEMEGSLSFSFFSLTPNTWHYFVNNFAATTQLGRHKQIKKTPLRIVIRVPLFATFLSTPHPMPHGRDCALKKILASLCAKFLRSFVIEFPIQFTFGMDTTTGHWWPCVCGNAFNEIKRQWQSSIIRAMFLVSFFVLFLLLENRFFLVAMGAKILTSRESCSWWRGRRKCGRKNYKNPHPRCRAVATFSMQSVIQQCCRG